MTATEKLRRLLDERGVEWGNIRRDGSESDYLTEWQFEDNQGKAIAIEWAVGSGLSVEVHRYRLTPEQAIDATLGRGMLTADDVRDLIERHSDASGGNGRDFHNGAYVAIADELNASLGSNNCTNSERTETCRVEETERFECLDSRYKSFDYNPYITVHVMECSACGGTYEHVNGGYEYCPRCGRRIVRED